jgi:hypothetical protein
MWRSLYGSPLWRKTPLRYESLFAGRDPKFQELILKKILLPSLHEIRDQQRELLKARCAVFKEELMMNRWHPTRIQKFMDDGILSDME